MIDFYLVTGFLGAGKTTFLKKFVHEFPGQKLRIIVNEFGKEGVDGQLLAPLGVTLSEITGGSIFCSCRMDQFEEVLAQVIKEHPDTIVVEASGLSDPTMVRKILAQDAWKDELAYKGCICLADAASMLKIYQTARVCKKQLSICDAVLLNKMDLVSEARIRETKERIHNQRPDVMIYETQYGAVPQGFMEKLRVMAQDGGAYGLHTADVSLHKLTVRVSESFSLYEFQKFLEMFAEETYRIKGFVKLEGRLYFADCVGSFVKVEPYAGEAQVANRIVVLYGYGLPALERVKEAAKWYADQVLEIS